MDAKVTSVSFLSDDILKLRLDAIHASLASRVPEITHISCLIHDPKTDLLLDFIHSSSQADYQIFTHLLLSELPILKKISESENAQVLSDIELNFPFGKEQSDALVSHGVQSAFIVPLNNEDRFMGFLIFQSEDKGVFTDLLQRDLVLHAQLISMTIASEIAIFDTLMATVKMARDFTDLRDFETGLHLDRMAIYAQLIAGNLRTSHNLSSQFVEHIQVYARLHDIGKIGIPDHILMKHEHLSPDERAIIETHVDKGVAILSQILDEYKLAHLPDSKMMLNIVAYHHEYLDGSGYPHQVRGEQIPIEARIVTVADIFDALTSRRPYKKIWSITSAIEELERMQSLNKVDGDCVAALKMNMAEIERIVVELADTEK